MQEISFSEADSPLSGHKVSNILSNTKVCPYRDANKILIGKPEGTRHMRMKKNNNRNYIREHEY